MTQKRLVSEDGRRTVLATSQDEIDRYEADGYVVPSARRRAPELANSGLEGQLRARASSTTEGQETFTGSTTPGAPANTKAAEDPFGDEADSDEEPKKPAEPTDEQKAAAAVAAKASARRPAPRPS